MENKLQNIVFVFYRPHEIPFYEFASQRRNRKWMQNILKIFDVPLKPAPLFSFLFGFLCTLRLSVHLNLMHPIDMRMDFTSRII